MEAVAAAAEAAACAADCSGPGSDGDAMSRSWDDGESRGKSSGREGKWGGPESSPSAAGGEGEPGVQHGMAAVAEDGEEEFVEDSQGEEEEEEQFDGEEEEEAERGFEEDFAGQRGRTEFAMDPNFDAPLAQSVEQDYLTTHSRNENRGLRRSEEGPEAVSVTGVGNGGEPTAGRQDIGTHGLGERVADLFLDEVTGDVAPTDGVGEGAASEGSAAEIQLAVVDSVADSAVGDVVAVGSDMGTGVEQPTAVELEMSQQDVVESSGVAETAGGDTTTTGEGEIWLEGVEGGQELEEAAAAAAVQVVSDEQQQAEAVAVVEVQESPASHSGRFF